MAMQFELIPVSGERRQINAKTRVAAPIAMNDRSVEPDRAVGGEAVELQFQRASPIRRLQSDIAAVPTDTARPVALCDISLGIEWPSTAQSCGRSSTRQSLSLN